MQDFGTEYTQTYLKKYLKEPIEVVVECANFFRKEFTVKMKIGEGTNKAMLSGGWAKAMDGYKMKEGQIYLFVFNDKDKIKGLSLLLMQLNIQYH